MKNDDMNLWVEKYRPNTIEDIILQPATKKIFESILAKGSKELPNLLFSGSPGCGKTTLAKAIAIELKMPKLYINASDEGNIDTIRTKVKVFCTSATVDDSTKLVILDEADGMSKAGQDSLRNLIETVHKRCRFVFTCNNPDKISSALKSRCKEIHFKPVELKVVRKRVVEILQSEKVKVDAEQVPKLKELMKKFYPDIRQIINQLQFFSVDKTLDIDFEEVISNDIYEEIVGMIKNKKLSNLRDILRNHKLDYEGIITRIFNDILNVKEPFDTINEGKKAECIMICGEYLKSSSVVTNQEINFACFCIELMELGI